MQMYKCFLSFKSKNKEKMCKITSLALCYQWHIKYKGKATPAVELF